jgi:hypothetical protein
MHARVSHPKISARPVATASPFRGGLSYSRICAELQHALFFRALKSSQSLPGNERANFQKLVRNVRDLLVLS